VNQDLRAYLKGLSKVGEFDSEGQFTVDVHKRNIKLSKSRFSDPTSYLLCCVRAAVTSESEQVFVRLKPDTTLVILKSPKKLRPEDIVESVLGSNSHSPTDHLLGAALQGGLAAGAVRVQVRLPNSEIRITQDTLKVVPKETAYRNVALSFGFPAKPIWSRRKKERCLKESQSVLSRCCFCPVPILMGGLSVVDNDGWESLLSWQRSDANYGVHRDFVWMEAFLPEGETRFPTGVSRRACRVEYVGGERHKTSQWDPRERSAFLRIVPKAQGKRHKVGMFIRLGSALDGPGRLYMVKQGVALEPVEENLGAPGVAVILRGDEFDTDVSLFKPILDGEGYDRLLKSVRAQVKALTVQLGRERKNFVFQPLHPKLMVKKASFCGAGGAVFGLLAGATGSLVFGGALFFVGALLEIWQNTDQMLVEAEQRVRWELDSYVNLVAPEDDGKTRL
jgi:hypothetical protein